MRDRLYSLASAMYNTGKIRYDRTESVAFWIISDNMYRVFGLKSWCEYNIDMNIPGESRTGMLEVLNIFQLKIDHIFLGLTLIFRLHRAKPGTQLV